MLYMYTGELHTVFVCYTCILVNCIVFVCCHNILGKDFDEVQFSSIILKQTVYN